MTNRKKTQAGMNPNNAMTVEQTPEETGAQAMARKLLQPTLKNAAAASAFTGKMMGSDLELPGIGDYADHLHGAAHAAAAGDLGMASKILAAQAITLDSMFAELARRSAMNMGEYIHAAERYGRLALKAQSNCRATLEALAKLHLPREQIVKHVHVNEGGQAVVADHFHNQTGASKIGQSNKQSHAAVSAGAGASLPRPDPFRSPVPGSGRKRSEKVPHARRDQPRCS